MPLLWLRVAAALYGFGMFHAILMLRQKGERTAKIAVPAVALGMVFHFVSFLETAMLRGYQELLTIRHAESGLALLVVFIFMVMFVRFRTASPAVLIFPLVFVLTLLSAIAQQPTSMITTSTLRKPWIVFHVSTLLIGYACLFFSFVSSLLYLMQSRQLKSKQSGSWTSRMPALQVIDELGYKALLVGFPFMTVGLLAGAVAAQEHYGPTYFSDPKIVLSAVMWTVYLVLLYTRWSSGWRGRKAAYLATFAFVAAVCAWAANYLSRVHRFVAP